MKKPYVWAGIIGVILLLGAILSAAALYAHPTDLMMVNIATAANIAANIAVGVFLLAVFLKGKKREDEGHIQAKPEPNSTADAQSLRRIQNWIFGFVLLSEMVGTLSYWILNNYAAGFTAMNILNIFDLVFNILLFYIVVELFRGKRDVRTLFLYTIIVYGVVETILFAMLSFWFAAAVAVVFSAYFVLGTLLPPNRMNFRLVNYIALPVFLALSLASPFFDKGAIPQLTKDEALAEQQWAQQTSALDVAYNAFLQGHDYSPSAMEPVTAAEVRQRITEDDMVANIKKLIAAYNKQLPSIAQKEQIRDLGYSLQLINLHGEQGGSIEGLLNYTYGLDYNHLTADQQEHIGQLGQEINDYNTQLTALQFKAGF